MMPSTYWKARKLFKSEQVSLEVNSCPKFFFKVKRDSVIIDLKEDTHSCTCESGSLWRNGKICKHIKACYLWLED